MQQMMDNRQISPEKSPSFLTALGQLPAQYLKVIVRPSVKTFNNEKDWALWSTVFLQFLVLVGITTALNFLGHAIPHAALHTIAAANFNSFSLFGWLPAPYNGIVFILATFLIGLGTAYPFSRASGGKGRFVEHAFILLLVSIPLVTISGALLLIPAAGSFVMAFAFVIGALFIYRMVLHGLTIMAVHHLSAQKAILIVLIIPIVLVIAGFLILFIVTFGKFLEGLDFPDLPFESSKRRKKRAAQPGD